MSARVAVVGSRVSHAAVVADPQLSVPPDLFMARLSLSGVGTPAAEGVPLEAVGSRFDQALVRRDVERTLVEDLVAADPDLIVVDLLEERLDLLLLDSGALLTVSPEFSRIGLASRGHRVVGRGDADRVALWSAGWGVFRDRLREAGLWDRVVLHRALLALSDADGGPVDGADTFESMNDFLRTLYDLAARDLPTDRVVAVEQEPRRASPADPGAVDPLSLSAPDAAHVARLLRAGLARTRPAALARDDLVPSQYPDDGAEVHRWPSPDAFAADVPAPGVHVLPLADGNHLDLVVRGDLAAVEEGRSVVVFLAGAVPARSPHAPPFFAGGRLTHELGIPWVAVSDPTLHLSEELRQGWYVGAAGSGTASVIAAALRAIVDRTGRSLLLVGGAGGAFAALQLARELDGRADVLAWNPQVDLPAAEPEELRPFLDIVLPDEDLDAAGPDDVARLLDAAGVPHRVESLLVGRRVLVLQNADDPQWVRQLMPLIARTGGMGSGPLVYSADADHVVRIADWGDRAAVLPVEAARAAVDGLSRGEPVADVLARITPLLDDGERRAARRAAAASGPSGVGPADAPPLRGGAPVTVTADDDGHVLLDWSAAVAAEGDDVVVDLLRTRGGRTVGRVDRVRPPLRIPHLAEGELWRLEVSDAAGRAVRSLVVDADGRTMADEVARPRRRREGADARAGR